ncbi:MAG: carbonic anhydrase [Phycisphaeraceae bacterium]
MPYTSDIHFEPERIHAAAVYCSDGRFGDQCDQFLHDHLQLPNYDRVALPGGPGALVGHAKATIDHASIFGDLHFLIEAHKLERVVLIAHEACAFYAMRLGLSADMVEQQQRADLHLVSQELRQIESLKEVLTYVARVRDGKVYFEPVKA